METTMVKKCTCSHEFQDQRYGAQMRVHNPFGSQAKGQGWRCTVCKKETR